MGDEKFRAKCWSESLKGRDYSEDLSVDGRIKVRWISWKYGFGEWIGFIWLRTGTSGGPL
jgi:hypothetical protein